MEYHDFDSRDEVSGEEEGVGFTNLKVKTLVLTVDHYGLETNTEGPCMGVDFQESKVKGGDNYMDVGYSTFVSEMWNKDPETVVSVGESDQIIDFYSTVTVVKDTVLKKDWYPKDSWEVIVVEILDSEGVTDCNSCVNSFTGVDIEDPGVRVVKKDHGEVLDIKVSVGKTVPRIDQREDRGEAVDIDYGEYNTEGDVISTVLVVKTVDCTIVAWVSD